MRQRSATQDSIRKGDAVVYARSFLQAVGALTGDLPHDAGLVIRIDYRTHSPDVLTVRWDIAGEVARRYAVNEYRDQAG